MEYLFEDRGLILSNDNHEHIKAPLRDRASGRIGIAMIELHGNSVFQNGQAKSLPLEIPPTSSCSNVTRMDGRYTINIAPSSEHASEPRWHIGGSLDEWRLVEAVEVASDMSVGRATQLGELLNRDCFLAFLDVKQGQSLASVDIRQADILSDHIPDHACVFVHPRQLVETIPDDWDLAAELRMTQAVGRGGCGDEKHVAVAALPAGCGLSSAVIEQGDILAVMDRAELPLLNSAAGLNSTPSPCEALTRCTMTKQPVGDRLEVMADASKAVQAALCSDASPLLQREIGVEPALADINAHEAFMLASLLKPLLSVRERLCPAALEASVVRTSWLWSGRGKARLWDEYCRVFDEVVLDIESEIIRSFAADVGSSRHWHTNPEKTTGYGDGSKDRSRVD
ncbi:type VI secretion system-associated FHA domain protein [Rhizobium johnstonii]|uniref:type VI secretion system-associated FHA domain protein n=1 Tax=Rhizobium johnstonii TaxID=3019933 RepID=UPI003F9BF350